MTRRSRSAAPRAARRSQTLDATQPRAQADARHRRGARSSTTYDELGRPKTMKQGAEQTTFAYDAQHRLASEHGRRRQRDRLRLRRRRPRDREAPAGQPGLQVQPTTPTATSTTMTTPRGKVHTLRLDRRRPAEVLHAARRERVRARLLDRAHAGVHEAARAAPPQVNGLRHGRPADVGGPRPDASARSPTTASRDRFDTVTRALAGGGGQAGDRRTPTTASCPRVAGVHGRGGRALRVHARRPDPADEREAHGGRRPRSRARWRSTTTGWRPRPARSRSSATAPAGAVSKITDGKLALTLRVRRATAGPATRTLSVGGTERFFQKLTFDNTGRAASREERVDGGALDTLAYGYDGSGPAADRQARRDGRSRTTPTTPTATGSAAARPTTTATG